MIYNQSLYYHRAGTPRVARYHLPSGEYFEAEFPNMAHKYDHYLYNLSYNYMDLAVDENSVWAVFRRWEENSLVLNQLDVFNLTVVKSWNFTNINHTAFSNAFVICGVFYLIDSSYETHSTISYAYDLYRNREVEVNIPWLNLHQNSNMIAYNPYDQRIYIYDHGYLLTVPTLLRSRQVQYRSGY